MTQGRFYASDLSLETRHRGAATLAAIALALALVAAGCGGGGRLSKAQYQARIQKDAQQIQEGFLPLGQPASSLRGFAKDVGSGQEKLRSVADDLASIKPPKEIDHDNQVLVRGLRKLDSKLEPLRRVAATGNTAAMRKAVRAFRSSRPLQEIQEATEAMKKKGYELGTLGD